MKRTSKDGILHSEVIRSISGISTVWEKAQIISRLIRAYFGKKRLKNQDSVGQFHAPWITDYCIVY